ncbi:hypothetical protein, partial [Pseudomonas sp. 65/3-MNA-CIBAN-0223]|uniref:hypothetical protein n=1 Tax=Pseudomonas sp. 65/3-MNA-CIBAN-0223 TaxID=3140476 RepID=UPI00331AFC0D
MFLLVGVVLGGLGVLGVFVGGLLLVVLGVVVGVVLVVWGVVGGVVRFGLFGVVVVGWLVLV